MPKGKSEPKKKKSKKRDEEDLDDGVPDVSHFTDTDWDRFARDAEVGLERSRASRPVLYDTGNLFTAKDMEKADDDEFRRIQQRLNKNLNRAKAARGERRMDKFGWVPQKKPSAEKILEARLAGAKSHGRATLPTRPVADRSIKRLRRNIDLDPPAAAHLPVSTPVQAAAAPRRIVPTVQPVPAPVPVPVAAPAPKRRITPTIRPLLVPGAPSPMIGPAPVPVPAPAPAHHEIPPFKKHERAPLCGGWTLGKRKNDPGRPCRAHVRREKGGLCPSHFRYFCSHEFTAPGWPAR